MRKIIMFLSILTFILLLVACEKGGNQIISQKFEGNTYTFVVSTDEDLTNEEQIEFTYNVAHTIYSELKDDIETSKRVLKLTLQINKEDSLTVIFNINESVEKPGLNLLTQYFH